MAKKFKVQAEVINVFNKIKKQAEMLEKNTTANVDDYDTNTLIVLSENGKKDSKGEYIYKPSIIFLDEVPSPEGTKLDVEAELKKNKNKNDTV